VINTTQNTSARKFLARELAVFIFAVAMAAPLLATAADLVTPGITGVVKAGTKIDVIKKGFTGTEGPVALPDGTFAFTETQANRITKIAPDGSTSTFLENTNGANGLGFNAQGDLIAVQVAETKVGVIYPQNRVKVLASNYEGAVFGRPNDLVVDKKGGVYFTDSGANAPAANAPQPEPRKDGLANAPTGKPAVYHIAPDGKLQRIANDVERPNGIQLSPDEKTLYVANTYGEYVLAYDIGADGKIGARRNFAKLAGFEKTETGWSSGADGLAVDKDGRLFVASNTGIQVFSSKGEALGTIELPKKPQNLAFAGADKSTLYVVGRGSAYKIATETSGYKGRAK
jgi:gluconolactonase